MNNNIICKQYDGEFYAICLNKEHPDSNMVGCGRSEVEALNNLKEKAFRQLQAGFYTFNLCQEMERNLDSFDNEEENVYQITGECQ